MTSWRYRKNDHIPFYKRNAEEHDVSFSGISRWAHPRKLRHSRAGILIQKRLAPKGLFVVVPQKQPTTKRTHRDRENPTDSNKTESASEYGDTTEESEPCYW